VVLRSGVMAVVWRKLLPELTNTLFLAPQVAMAGMAACVIVVAVGTHSQRTTLQQIYSNADQVNVSYLRAGTEGGGNHER
jgi:hypothetical protein